VLREAWRMLTVFGIVALSFMMGMYALERRGRAYVAGFAGGCALSSAYGFLSGAWPFGVIEGIWTAIALRRWWWYIDAADQPGP
jgi:hypothetical protein